MDDLSDEQRGALLASFRSGVDAQSQLDALLDDMERCGLDRKECAEALLRALLQPIARPLAKTGP
jgi:hypothetical protein